MAFQRKRSGSDDSDLSRTPEEWQERGRNLLLNKLTRGPRSRFQLQQMLTKYEVPEQIAEELLDRFTEVALIDDAAFAKAFAHDRRATRGLSKAALKRELGKVGIAPQLIQDALEDIEADDEYKLAIDLVRRRWNSVKNLEWQARQRRLSGFLGRRGFGGNVVSSAIRAVEQENR